MNSRILTATVCLISILLLVQIAGAATCESRAFHFRLDVPDGWNSVMSSNKAAARLIFDDEPELSVTFQARNARKPLRPSAVVALFKQKYRRRKKTENKVAVTIKPSRTLVGEYKAIQYGFRWRDFIDETREERTLWFNAKDPDTGRLYLFKAEVKGPALAVRSRKKDIQAIIASFTMFSTAEESSPRPVQASSGSRPVKTVSASVERTDTAPQRLERNDGSSSGAYVPAGRSAGATGNAGSGIADSGGDGTVKPFRVSAERCSPSDYSYLYGKVRKRKVASLTSNARRIEDPERLAKMQKTFYDRNRMRTAEQKRRAKMYFGGAGRSADESAAH